MRPVLFEVFGLPIHSYGVSKAAAALVAGYLLAREFRRLGWHPDRAWSIVVVATVVGFVGGKLYYLAEHAGELSAHSLGPSGFTWYGGLIAGIATVVVMARRYGLPLAQLAGVAAAPMSLAYGIGRIGCFLAGDGSYGQPSDLPWATAFPDGMVPTLVPVHPAALYEAVVALAVGGLLWVLRTRWSPLQVFGLYAVLSGSARFLVEEIRINPEALFGLTQPQLWSALLVAVGVALLVIGSLRGRPPAGAGSEEMAPGGTTDRDVVHYRR
jgi:phosphatidylglycerol:prolipoprotein diacylglycerol transferase